MTEKGGAQKESAGRRLASKLPRWGSKAARKQDANVPVPQKSQAKAIDFLSKAGAVPKANPPKAAQSEAGRPESSSPVCGQPIS